MGCCATHQEAVSACAEDIVGALGSPTQVRGGRIPWGGFRGEGSSVGPSARSASAPLRSLQQWWSTSRSFLHFVMGPRADIFAVGSIEPPRYSAKETLDRGSCYCTRGAIVLSNAGTERWAEMSTGGEATRWLLLAPLHSALQAARDSASISR